VSSPPGQATPPLHSFQSNPWVRIAHFFLSRRWRNKVFLKGLYARGLFARVCSPPLRRRSDGLRSSIQRSSLSFPRDTKRQRDSPSVQAGVSPLQYPFLLSLLSVVVFLSWWTPFLQKLSCIEYLQPIKGRRRVFSTLISPDWLSMEYRSREHFPPFRLGTLTLEE